MTHSPRDGGDEASGVVDPSRGFLQSDSDEADDLFVEARDRVTRALEGDDRRKPDIGYLVGKIRDTLNSFVYERTRRRPMILPVITEV